MPSQSPFKERLLRIENLFWAWEKAKGAYSFDKTWFDEVELAEFEASLRSNLLGIRDQFETGTYSLEPARLVAFPKRGERRDTPATRQMFWFSVRDQVAWLALVNVIGPLIDRHMPSWSYGDRLYRSVWRDRGETELDDLPSRLKVGPYRHSSRYLYRPFKHAWPRYRRHLYLTAMVMGRGSQDLSLSHEDQTALEEERNLGIAHVRVPYLRADYWNAGGGPVYWASVDLKKFFPNTPVSLVRDQLVQGLRRGRYRGELDGLLNSMLRFPVDTMGWTETELTEEFGLGSGNRQVFGSIPTGLLVAGFLANAALLGVDTEVETELGTSDSSNDHRIAHFRYVDDHTVLAREPEDLVSWIGKYQQILHRTNPDWSINEAKTEPPAVRGCLTANSSSQGPLDLAPIRDEPLDVDFPRPLLSHTLAKISAIAATRFELLDDEGQEQFIRDVEMLLLGDFGETEVRPETRASFAAAVLARSDLHLRQLTSASWQASHTLQACKARLHWLQTQKDAFREEMVPAAVVEEYLALQRRMPDLMQAHAAASKKLLHTRRSDKARHFRLILSAIRRFPDKIRLWMTAVRYCGRVGHDGLGELVKLLGSADVVAPLTQSFVSAVVAHAIANEILRSVRLLNEEESDDETRRVAAQFLDLAATRKFVLSTTPRWYERRAVALLTAAAWSAAVTQEAARPRSLLDVSDQPGRNPRFLAVRTGHGNPRAAARRTRCLGRLRVESSSLALWLNRSLEPKTGKPSAIWAALAPSVGAREPGARSFFGRYPSLVSESMLIEMGRGLLPPFSDNPGWFYEAVSGRPEKERARIQKALHRRNATLGRQIVKLMRARPSPRYADLSSWAAWARRYPHEGPQSLERSSDPRLGEWTSLQIVRLVCKSLRDFRRADRPALHHATITIPVRWMNLTGTAPGGLSWDEWARVAPAGPVRFTSIQIDDERYMGPAWRLESTATADWPWIRALGLLLLGMLNRSFEWPASWNPDFWQNGRPELASRTVATLSCSSLTTAILHSTLTARSRENVIRRIDLQEEQVDADTLFDPPLIASLADLDTWLRRSMKVLEIHQMSGHERRPRQLVPVMLRQLTRPEWASLAEDQAR